MSHHTTVFIYLFGMILILNIDYFYKQSLQIYLQNSNLKVLSRILTLLTK